MKIKRNVILYIAVSLDGYIADSNGSVNWIKGQDESVEPEDTFSPFFDSIDTVVMGKRTYDQIVTELSPDQWPYIGATTFVITHDDKSIDAEHIHFRNTSVCRLVDELKELPGKNIWICGGAQIANQLIGTDMIDTYHIAVIPVILGGGIKLFDTTEQRIDLTLARTKEYNGIIELTYHRKQSLML